jgi:hypothetical protein
MKAGVFGKLLMTLTLFGANQAAFASYSFFNRPLKLLTCEMMLRTPVKELSLVDNSLPVLRDAVYYIASNNPGSANDGITYASLSEVGDLSRFGVNKAARIIQRLNGIEKNLTGTNLNSQTVAIEIRGDDIRKALSTMEASEVELRKIYKSADRKLSSFGRRVALGLLTATIAWSSYDWLQATVAGLTQWHFDVGVLYSGLMTLNMLKVGRNVLEYNQTRFDWSYPALKSFLNKAIEGSPTNEFFIASSNIWVPSEFHKMLMGGDVGSADDGRQIGLEEWGDSYSGWIVRQVFRKVLFQLIRNVSNAGDLTRNIYVDHIVFYDNVAREPVWLFFYRAFRNQPSGRKPTKREQQEMQTDQQWVPGASPVPVLGR